MVRHYSKQKPSYTFIPFKLMFFTILNSLFFNLNPSLLVEISSQILIHLVHFSPRRVLYIILFHEGAPKYAKVRGVYTAPYELQERQTLRLWIQMAATLRCL